MNGRTILTLLLVVGLVAPAAGITVTAQSNSTPTPSDGGPAAQADGTGTDESNYTRLYIDDQHHHLELQPGETDSVTVTVENGEDEPVDLSPRVYISPRGERPIEKSWISIQETDTTLDAGAEREFNITVSVPEETELNRYSGMIAFTDEMATYPGQPERPVHALSLNVEVWEEPSVNILSDRHAYAQAQAGDTFTREIVVENTGDEAVPVNPQLNTERNRRMPPGNQETLDRSWLEIDAPNEIGSGERETIEVAITPPADAERGNYRTELNLGLKDPARPDRSSHWQEVNLNFQVWTQPEEPYESSFAVREDAENITLELAANRPHYDVTAVESSEFNVTFVSPSGEEITANRVQVTNQGRVALGETQRGPASDDSTYSTGPEQQTFRYQVENPEAGSWSVRIMPHNTMEFRYEIVRQESN